MLAPARLVRPQIYFEETCQFDLWETPPTAPSTELRKSGNPSPRLKSGCRCQISRGVAAYAIPWRSCPLLLKNARARKRCTRPLWSMKRWRSNRPISWRKRGTHRPGHRLMAAMRPAPRGRRIFAGEVRNKGPPLLGFSNMRLVSGALTSVDRPRGSSLMSPTPWIVTCRRNR